MKFVLLFATLLAAAVMMTGAGDKAVSYLDAGKVATALAKGAVMVKQSDLAVQGGHRDAAGQVDRPLSCLLAGTDREIEDRAQGNRPMTRESDPATVIVECELPEPREKVWKALTVPELLAHG